MNEIFLFNFYYDSTAILKHCVIRTLKFIFIYLGFCTLYSCSAQHNTLLSRGMQNLTAQYNYLYNARAILNEEKQVGSPTTEQLDQVIQKASKVISEKRYSKYLPEAYLLLAEAHFLKGNHFLSAAYFKYLSETYASDIHIHIKGLEGNARNLLQLDQQAAAVPFLDSLKVKLQLVSKHKAAPLATLAQGRIAVKDYKAAIIYLEAAIKEKNTRQQRNQWFHSLAQLYEAEKDHSKALYYTKKAEKHRNNVTNPAIKTTAQHYELKDPEETSNTRILTDLNFSEDKMMTGENVDQEGHLGKNFNTVAEKYRKSKYFTYVQQQPPSEITLQPVIPETPPKNLPLPAENDYKQLTAAKNSAVTDNIFDMTPSNDYYFVIVVNDASINLSSSRFGIGEFNRGNFAGQGLKHRLEEFDNDQLIYIGNFSNFDVVKIYAEGIRPLLQKIMKVPAKSYQSFISSKENFEKINSKDHLNKYLEFYKNNF